MPGEVRETCRLVRWVGYFDFKYPRTVAARYTLFHCYFFIGAQYDFPLLSHFVAGEGSTLSPGKQGPAAFLSPPPGTT
jgi:hypothetical protein